MIIDGKIIKSKDTISVYNPFNDELIDTVSKAKIHNVDQAIECVKKYDYKLSEWDRYEILKNYCDILMSEKEKYIELLCSEAGKTIKESKIELERSFQTFLLSSEEAKRINGEVLSTGSIKNLPNKMGIVIREPIGVVLAITPFNYPLNLVAHKVGPALAANNPVLLKPSSLTPLTAMQMAQDLFRAGLPNEMLQIITGDSNVIGDYLISNKFIDKISFTGSEAVGENICKNSGMKSISMELGSIDPLIILDDVNIDNAVEIALDGAFGNSGQRCTSVKKIIIDENIADEFSNKLVYKAQKLKVGNQLNPKTDIGPLINKETARDIEKTVKKSIANGSKLCCGGKRKGSLFWPTVLDFVDDDDSIVSDEIFGPIAPMIRVKNFEESIKIANASNYGLQTGIITNNYEKIKYAITNIQSGAIVVNNHSGFRSENLPFGGIKKSGMGREGVKYAINEMTKMKTIIFY